MARHLKLSFVSPEDSPLAGLLERFLTSRRAKGLVPGSIHWYKINLTIYLRWLALHPRFAWDDASAIDLFMADQRDEGLKDNTIHGRYRALSVWFGWLRRRRHIAENPMEMVDPPSVKKTQIQHMTLAEYQKLFASIKGEDWIDKRDRCLFYVIFWCGLRISEACNLRQGDIDPSTKIVTIKSGKGGEPRPVPCGDDLYPLILDYLWSRPPYSRGVPSGLSLSGITEDVLFVGSNGGGGVRSKLTPGGAAIVLKRRCAAAGLRPMSPHKGRHGLAMEMLNGGLEMSAVSKVLGHSNQKTTADFYARWLTGPLAEKYTEVRDKLLSPKTSK